MAGRREQRACLLEDDEPGRLAGGSTTHHYAQEHCVPTSGQSICAARGVERPSQGLLGGPSRHAGVTVQPHRRGPTGLSRVRMGCGARHVAQTLRKIAAAAGNATAANRNKHGRATDRERDVQHAAVATMRRVPIRTVRPSRAPVSGCTRSRSNARRAKAREPGAAAPQHPLRRRRRTAARFSGSPQKQLSTRALWPGR